MNQIRINGQILPTQLVTAIANKTWPPAAGAAKAVSPPIQDTTDLTFLNILRMRKETQSLINDLFKPKDNRNLFRLTSGESHKPDFLNVDYAVIIALTYGQEFIVLDYSVGMEPRILATQYATIPSGGEDLRWVEIAKNFSTLVEKLQSC